MTTANLSKFRDDAPVMIRDTGAYCLRQTPILTLLAVLPPDEVSLVRMNCSSVPPESVTKESWLLSDRSIMAGWPPRPGTQGFLLVSPLVPPISVTVPLRFWDPLSVTFDDASNTMYPRKTSGCPG